MVMVKPFKAIRPNKDIVNRVAALPYDTMNTKEARKMAENNEFSYLRIDRAEIDLPPDTDIHSEEVYKKANENLQEFMNKGVFIQDEKPHLYIYREIMDNREQVGIVGCVSVDDNINGRIKKHEHTKPDKVQDRINHIKYCEANTGTILLTYEKNDIIENIVQKKIKDIPEYDFISNDEVRHTVWILNEEETRMVEDGFNYVENLYIADGHHRSKAAEEYALKKRKENPKYDGTEEFNYYLAMIAPKENLFVMDYNRVIEDLNGMDVKTFINNIEENFEVTQEKIPYKPLKKYEYGMFLDGEWYKLSFKYKERLNTPIEKLDVSVLHDYLIEPILDIDQPQKNKRIDFIGGIRGIEEIQKRVEDGMTVGFSLYPTAIDELMEIADRGEVMPAKSTWFEPKVRCGLFLHKI